METMSMQNLGGQTKSIMVFLKVACNTCCSGYLHLASVNVFSETPNHSGNVHVLLGFSDSVNLITTFGILSFQVFPAYSRFLVLKRINSYQKKTNNFEWKNAPYSATHFHSYNRKLIAIIKVIMWF